MACNWYVELPEELVQHIQSFLDPKQAARTSVLSKLWYSAWSTRPVLSLNYYNFPRTETRFTDFKNHARTSINRYQKLNLKLNTFKLNLDDADEFTRADDGLILSALTLGVNDLNLSFCEYTTCKYTLPHQVFSSICLKKLYIRGCIINLPQSNGKSKVICSRLVSLDLCCVRVTDDMVRDILLGCPLLEDLRVDHCSGLISMDITSNSLRYLSLEWIRGLRFIKVQVPNIQNFKWLVTSRDEIPSLSFTTVSKEWSSDLRFHHSRGKDRDADVSWWLKIRNILRELSYSKISIAIESLSDDQLGSISEEIIQSNHTSPFVENLMIKTRERGKKSYGWLLCCRPKYITWTDNFFHYNNNELNIRDILLYYQQEKNLLQLIYYELKNHGNKILMHGLEEVDMEHCDETLREWRRYVRPLKLQRVAHEEGKFRLRLKWTNKVVFKNAAIE